MTERPPSHPKVRTPEAAASLRPDMTRGFSIGGGMDSVTAARFFTKVNKDTPSGCWLWMRLGRRGYGSFRVNGRMETPHRVSWAYHCGPIPDGLCVLHHCDNPPCVNPAHLRLGTQLDNAADREARGRGNHICGEDHGQVKLTLAIVRKILASDETAPMLAARYGVRPGAVRDVRSRRTWKHVNDHCVVPAGPAIGGRNPSSKLTESDVRLIRSSSKPSRALADQFGVSLACVGFVRTRRTWRHVK